MIYRCIKKDCINYDEKKINGCGLHIEYADDCLQSDCKKYYITNENKTNKNKTNKNKTNKLIAIETCDKDKFEKQCNEAISFGFNISSTACTIINSEKHDFCACYQAILIKERDENE